MKLMQVKLENFRCYSENTIISFDDLTAIVGKNDTGKSTILDALDIFFNDAKIDKKDASVDGNSGQVSITCIFSNLPINVIIDQDYPTSLADEFLLNPDGYLEVRKTYNCSIENPKEPLIK